MTTFVDTSALLAVLNGADNRHPEARAIWERLLREGSTLVCTDYILVETIALLQNRLGLQAVRLFRDDVLPVLTVKWVDALIFDTGLAMLSAAGRRQLSLVDCVSFEVMRALGLRSAFAFDRDFAEQGFEIIPQPGDTAQ
jgi:uncharacterized protein